jgi:hypothetical protein
VLSGARPFLRLCPRPLERVRHNPFLLLETTRNHPENGVIGKFTKEQGKTDRNLTILVKN